MTDILDLLEPLEPPFESTGKIDWGVELLVVDFSDAFLSLLVNEKERGYTMVTDGQGTWFTYRGFPFGLVSGPLVWGRVVAYFTRLAQAVYHSAQEARVQTYVDDPLISLVGTRKQRDWAAAVTCLVWVMVGSDHAWKKARFGNRVSWIGAEFAVQNNGVIVSMSDDRDKIRARLEEVLRVKGMVAGLEKLAGELSWVAGLIPRIRPFCSHLWAA